jgi:hypothetical protein
MRRIQMGADHIFGTLVKGTAAAYADCARDYFERDLDLDAVAQILDGHPISEVVVASLNPEAVFSAVALVDELGVEEPAVFDALRAAAAARAGRQWQCSA